MKAILVGDLHLRPTPPAKRKDNFLDAQYNKVLKIFEYGEQYKAPIILTGDVFDYPQVPYWLLVKYWNLFYQHNQKYGVIATPGNHDVYGANPSTLPNTALGMFLETGAIQITSPGIRPGIIVDEHYGQGELYIAGYSYMDSEVPETPSSSFAKSNVLIYHGMILYDKLWREQEDFIMADDFLKKTHPGWNLILCGHYHYQFMGSYEGRLIVNPGAVVRIKASKGDMAMKPSVMLWDEFNIEVLPLPHQESGEVFAKIPVPTKTLVEDKFTEAVAAYLSEEEVAEADIADIVMQVIDKSDCNERAKELVHKFVAEAQGI